MPKTFPIMIEVEEIALGPVLRKLNDMPGIAKLHLDLGHGGLGAGKKQLEQHAAARNGNTKQAVISLLMSGPKHIGEIARAIGGAKSRAYSAMTQLRKLGVAEAGPGKSMHQLSKKARAQLGAVPALPAPVSHGPAGRATPGSGPIVLRAALEAGPLRPVELRDRMASQGMSAKSATGVMMRAKRDGLIKKNGSGYQLTAKGMKIATGAQAHG